MDLQVRFAGAGDQCSRRPNPTAAIADDWWKRVAMLKRVSWNRMVVRAVALMFAIPGVDVRAQTTPEDRSSAFGAGYKISGTIVNALDGSPLGRARVSLIDTKNRTQAVSMVTSESGHFEFRGLPAGKFALEGAKRGFLEAGYQQHEQFSTAIVTGAGFNTENLVLRLTPFALLSGRVVDEAGDPVRNARVTLFVENHRGGLDRIFPAGFSATDDQGTYES